MAFKNLYPDEMIQISGTWIDPASKAHEAILANDEIKPITVRIRAAHELLATAAQPVDTPRLNTIIEQEARIDARHDAIIRGIWGFLTAKAELIGGDAGNAFISLRDLLLPDGLQSQLKTYRGEAGQARQLADRMTPAVRAQTDGILIGQGPNAQTLTYYVDELIVLGKQLGTFEDERAVLEAGDHDGGALQKARNKWVRVVNAFVSNAEMAEIDAETDALLFEPLRVAEKKADERARQTAAATKAATEKAAKAAAEKAAAEKAAAEKAAAEKAAAEKAAAEKAAGQPPAAQGADQPANVTPNK